MRVEDIRNGDDVVVWLNTVRSDRGAGEAKGRRWAILLAHRAAMRVLPIAWRYGRSGRQTRPELKELPYLRAGLASGVAGASVAASTDMRRGCYEARAALQELPDRRGLYPSSAIGAVDYANALVYQSADAAHASALAGTAFEGAGAALVGITRQDLPAWQAAQADCAGLVDGNVETLPLWPGANPLSDIWNDVKSQVVASGQQWSFWVEWYEKALRGEPQDWNLLTEVALIPQEDWDKGPEHVNAIIAGKLEQRALERSENGERIETNPETGRLRLVSDSDLPVDITTYALRKMARAVALFGENPENQYTPLKPVLLVVRDAIADAGNLPVELYDACASSSRLIVRLAVNQVVPSPEQDALIYEYLSRIREAAADILANDRKTREVLERRNAIAGNDALLKERENAVSVAERLADLSEGLLAKALPRDAATATDPNADPEDRKISSFRYAARLLRIMFVSGVRVAGAAGSAIVRTEKILSAVRTVLSTPQVQAVLQAAFRFLGL